MTYQPKPIDTSLTKLSKDVDELTEILAQNIHELWAQKRIAEGWSFGPQRDDVRKQHPDIVPYEDLPESEKAYDRQTAVETIKALLAKGYEIEAPTSSGSDATDSVTSKDGRAAARLIETQVPQDKATILELWAKWDLNLAIQPQVYRDLAERLIGLMEPLVAYDVASEGLRHFEDDIRLRQLQALALARSGAIESANAELRRLYDEGSRDEETLGILASTHKNMALLAPTPAIEKRHLAQAYAYYNEAYELSGKYYSGINAAAMALLLGDKPQAESLARDVQQACHRDLEKSKTDRSELYWLLATQGEAALILGDWDQAEHCYLRAMQLAGRAWGDRQSSRRQALLLLRVLGGDSRRVEGWFRMPRVVVFVGHMIDQPGRAFARFPPELEFAVFASIRDRLKGFDAGFGYASAACGSDILFHEAMLELGGEIHVCLPYNRAEFVADSVNIVPGADWSMRFDRVIEQTPDVQVVSPERLFGGSIVYDYANRILHGSARDRADQLGAELIFLAVWDKKPGDGPHGTASTIKRWRRSGNRVEIIDLAEILRRDCLELSSQATARTRTRESPKTKQEFSPEIVSMLFADAKGFSKLSELQVPLFVRHLWGLVREMLATKSHAPINCNTWGDALYFVFSKVRDAGQFALELSDRVSGTDWLKVGLPAETALRIGLHAGPAYACIDPVTKRKTYVGAQVSRAARIEPITPPGAIYVSQYFSALAKADQVEEFHCGYVGQMSMAKGYGTFPVYVLRRNSFQR
jgi:class 3 adenylate cyclase/tetratricopeptide (TPR) repeat protein